MEYGLRLATVAFAVFDGATHLIALLDVIEPVRLGCDELGGVASQKRWRRLRTTNRPAPAKRNTP